MAVLQVVGNRPGVGKTCLIGAVLSHLAATGRSAEEIRHALQAMPDTD